MKTIIVLLVLILIVLVVGPIGLLVLGGAGVVAGGALIALAVQWLPAALAVAGIILAAKLVEVFAPRLAVWKRPDRFGRGC